MMHRSDASLSRRSDHTKH